MRPFLENDTRDSLEARSRRYTMPIVMLGLLDSGEIVIMNRSFEILGYLNSDDLYNPSEMLYLIVQAHATVCPPLEPKTTPIVEIEL